MIIDIVVGLIKKHFYIISFEKYKNTVSDRVLERYGCKHPLLTPEIIILNDQAHGFKRLKTKLKTLEKFPIYCEIEYLGHADDTQLCIIDSFDLFSEVTLSIQEKFHDLTNLAETFKDYVQVDRVKTLGVDDQSSLLFYSKLNKLFYEQFLENDIEEVEINEKEINLLITKHIKHFINFIKCCDEILIKKKKIAALDPDLLP